MSLYEKFTSNQNKGMLWTLLSDDGVFKNIPDHKAASVKNDFDQKIQTIGQYITPADNLLAMCKRFITEMIKDIEKYKTPEKMTLGYNAAEISQNRQKIFQEELTTKKKEFETFNATPTPDKIDFSDNLDSPIGSEMDKILAEQIALREKQLNMVLQTQDKEAASKWIQNEGKKPDIQQLEEPPKLKIGENIEVREAKIKRVNFADESSTATSTASSRDDFISLLKKEPIASAGDTTNALLREILNKQNQILDLLQKK